VEFTVLDIALIAVRAILAATFFVAGAAKLASAKALVALRDFGIPRFAQPLLLLLPWAEIAIACGLLFALTAWYAAWGAAVLLGIFTIGIAANLIRGRRPPCNCFGQVHRKPISPWTLARNGVLAAAAWWIIQNGPPPASADAWVFVRGLDTHGRMVAMMIGIVSAIAVMFLVRDEEEDKTPLAELDMPTFDEMLGKAPAAAAPAAAERNAPAGRERAAPEVRYAAPGIVLNGDGLPVGMAAPAFELPDIHGERHSLASLLAGGKPLLLVFTSPHCESCQALMPKLPALAADHAEAFRLVLIGKGSAEQNLAKLKGVGDLLVLLQKDYEVAEAFNSTASPAAVMVGLDGTIKSGLAAGGAAVLELIARS
jgi:thiol-disulfide isomerase/thioredoxin